MADTMAVLPNPAAHADAREVLPLLKRRVARAGSCER